MGAPGSRRQALTPRAHCRPALCPLEPLGLTTDPANVHPPGPLQGRPVPKDWGLCGRGTWGAAPH